MEPTYPSNLRPVDNATQEQDNGDNDGIQGEEVDQATLTPVGVRHVIAYHPEEQADFARRGWIPLNTEMHPDPDNGNQLREHVFPGTWENFSAIRYAGMEVQELEWTLALAHGLSRFIAPGDPTIRQFLRARLAGAEPQQAGAQMPTMPQGNLTQMGPMVSAPTIPHPEREGDQSGTQQPAQVEEEATSAISDAAAQKVPPPPTEQPAWFGNTPTLRFVDQ